MQPLLLLSEYFTPQMIEDSSVTAMTTSVLRHSFLSVLHFTKLKREV
jgi:hypothetical protein